MPDNHPRWLAFGFDLPGHPRAPDVPQNLIVTPGAVGSQMQFLHCDDSRGADGYRFQPWSLDGKWQLAEQLPQHAEATFNPVATGTQVKAVVKARKATGESQPSAAVTAVMPQVWRRSVSAEDDRRQRPAVTDRRANQPAR